MTRKSLCAEIKTVSVRLNSRHKKLQVVSNESKHLIEQINPLLLIGIALLSGATANLIGFRKSYKLFGICQSVYPFITNYADVFINKKTNE